jgi:hypothetical protein
MASEGRQEFPELIAGVKGLDELMSARAKVQRGEAEQTAEAARARLAPLAENAEKLAAEIAYYQGKYSETLNRLEQLLEDRQIRQHAAPHLRTALEKAAGDAKELLSWASRLRDLAAEARSLSPEAVKAGREKHLAFELEGVAGSYGSRYHRGPAVLLKEVTMHLGPVLAAVERAKGPGLRVSGPPEWPELDGRVRNTEKAEMDFDPLNR